MEIPLRINGYLPPSILVCRAVDRGGELDRLLEVYSINEGFRGDRYSGSGMSKVAWNLSSQKTDSLRYPDRNSSCKESQSDTQGENHSIFQTKGNPDKSGPIIVKLHEQLNSITQSLNVNSL